MLLPLGLSWLLLHFLSTVAASNTDKVNDFFKGSDGRTSSHTNNWAVLISSSRYWFNYRVCEMTSLLLRELILS